MKRMAYEVWDTETANLLGSFDTEEEADELARTDEQLVIIPWEVEDEG